jgi:hypothetical protein
MRTEFCTIAAIGADHRFINFIIPKDGSYNTGLFAVSASYTLGNIQLYPSTFFRHQSIGRAYSGTGWVRTSPTDNYDKSSLHPPGGLYPYTGSGQTCLTLSPGTGKHTTLTADTFIYIFYG